MRRYFIETWGCQMNELDSQRLGGQLMQQGVLPTDDPAEADVILLNSCSVREKAAQKAYSRLGEYRRLKKERPGLVIGFCGCVAQQEGEAALERLPELDFVLGPARVGELIDVLRQRRTGERVVATGFPAERHFDLDAVDRDGIHKGMVTIIEGCNKKCTFCIVPTTRGPERCRPLAEVLAEVRYLVRRGFVEIELLGQTVNHWREPSAPSRASARNAGAANGELDFADLLETVATLPGVRRLRFVTSYPRDFTPRMVEQVGKHENICPYLHLPVQSGSDRLLRLMGRGYAIESYLQLVEDLRRARPGLAVSTDLIVGFPGESEDDHRASLQLVERVRFAQIFAFKYSPRPGTAAPRLALPAVDDEVASRRLHELLALQKSIQKELNDELVGRTMDVLVTGWGREGQQTGRTVCHRIVLFAAGVQPARPGELVTVRIDAANHHSLLASRLADPSTVAPPLARSSLRVVPTA
ncbi:MAG TPA: tRNA (N6-isopentenyl adenosine(37)-C2)-methylthiotransferase MiaB [Thermoanaerobaculia bacterium]|nr:tRNA (N6-isopentenyl adenosine(37)-C2)-methylthiotransferase MiaB [Thermoanaerobaculia bacterium]